MEKLQGNKLTSAAFPTVAFPLCSVSRANPASPSAPEKCHPEGHLSKVLCSKTSLIKQVQFIIKLKKTENCKF